MHLTYFKRVIIRLNGFHRVLPSVMGLARIKSSFSVLCSLCLPGKRRTTFCGFLWVFVGFCGFFFVLVALGFLFQWVPEPFLVNESNREFCLVSSDDCHVEACRGIVASRRHPSTSDVFWRTRKFLANSLIVTDRLLFCSLFFSPLFHAEFLLQEVVQIESAQAHQEHLQTGTQAHRPRSQSVSRR